MIMSESLKILKYHDHCSSSIGWQIKGLVLTVLSGPTSYRDDDDEDENSLVIVGIFSDVFKVVQIVNNLVQNKLNSSREWADYWKKRVAIIFLVWTWSFHFV